MTRRWAASSDSEPSRLSATLAELNAEEAEVDTSEFRDIAAWTQHSDPGLAAEACRAMVLLQPHPQHLELRWTSLQTGFRHPDPRVREEACAAAGDLKQQAEPPDGFEMALANRLDDSEGRVQFEAALALAHFKNQLAYPILKEALKRPRLRLDALKALGRLGAPEAESEIRAHCLRPWSAWVDRLAAAATLVQLGFARHRLLIIDRLSAWRFEERSYAANLVKELNLLEAEPKLLSQVNKGDSASAAMLEALASMGGFEAAENLDALKTEEARQTAEAIRCRLAPQPD